MLTYLAKSEMCSTKLEVEPNEALKFTVRPLKKEIPTVMEPVKALNNEMCSTKFEAEPSEALKLLTRPLVSTPT